MAIKVLKREPESVSMEGDTKVRQGEPDSVSKEGVAILQEARKLAGTNFVVNSRFKPFAIRDGLLITGQQQYSGGAAAKLVIEAGWPSPDTVGVGVLDGESPRARIDVLDPDLPGGRQPHPMPELEAGAPFDRKGRTFLEGVMLGVRDALAVLRLRVL